MVICIIWPYLNHNRIFFLQNLIEILYVKLMLFGKIAIFIDIYVIIKINNKKEVLEVDLKTTFYFGL